MKNEYAVGGILTSTKYEKIDLSGFDFTTEENYQKFVGHNMTEKEQIESCAKSLRELNSAVIRLCESAKGLGTTFEELSKNIREWQLNRIPKEDIEKYKGEILTYAEQVGFNQNEIANKLTDRVLRSHYLNRNVPQTVIVGCLA